MKYDERIISRDKESTDDDGEARGLTLPRSAVGHRQVFCACAVGMDIDVNVRVCGVGDFVFARGRQQIALRDQLLVQQLTIACFSAIPERSRSSQRPDTGKKKKRCLIRHELHRAFSVQLSTLSCHLFRTVSNVVPALPLPVGNVEKEAQDFAEPRLGVLHVLDTDSHLLVGRSEQKKIKRKKGETTAISRDCPPTSRRESSLFS